MLAAEAASKTTGWRLWATYSVLLTLSTWTFVFGAMVALPCAVLALHRGCVRAYAVATAVATLGSAPIVIITQAQTGQVSWIDTNALKMTYDIIVSQFFFGQHPYGAETSTLALFAWALSAVAWGLVAAYIIRCRKSKTFREGAVLGIWIVTPALNLAGLTLLGMPLYVERYLTFTAPALCLWLGMSIATMTPKAGAAALCTFAVLALPILVHQKTEGAKPDNYAALADWVDERKESGSAAIFSNIRSRGLSVSYPEQFAGIEDTAMSVEPVNMGNFWGRNFAPEELPLKQLKGQSVFVFNLTEYPEGSTNPVDPMKGAAKDPYVTELTSSGCQVDDATSLTTFTAYLLRC
ncbi:hypothetical protein IWX65_003372 [Arthrobacter sp. CAN_A214]|uniref:hypothetical protein n=1 Tax=Arthrobacter sp. CAN_A214 TaxID=2787720 RepID=UPI0018CB08F5